MVDARVSVPVGYRRYLLNVASDKKVVERSRCQRVHSDCNTTLQFTAFRTQTVACRVAHAVLALGIHRISVGVGHPIRKLRMNKRKTAGRWRTSSQGIS